MGFEGAFRALILAVPNVAELVGRDVYLAQVPPGVKTGDIWAVWQVVGGSEDRTLDGRSGLFQTRVQLDHFATGQHMKAVNLDREIYDAFAVEGVAQDGVYFGLITSVGVHDDAPEKVGGEWHFRRRRDYLVSWKQL